MLEIMGPFFPGMRPPAQGGLQFTLHPVPLAVVVLGCESFVNNKLDRTMALLTFLPHWGMVLKRAEPLNITL